MNETGGISTLGPDKGDVRFWTLIGDVSSGKTFLTFAALQRPEFAKDLALRPEPATERNLATRLKEHITLGTPDATSSGLVEYRFSAGLSSGANGGTVRVVLTDGPGGESVRSVARQISGTVSAVAKEFVDRVGVSDALLLILPHPGHNKEAGLAWRAGLISFINSLPHVLLKRPVRIGLCISKVDQSPSFARMIRNEEGCDMGWFTRTVYREADDTSAICHALSVAIREMPDVSSAVFPVSSFGVVRGTRRPNALRGLSHPLVHHLQVPSKTGRLGVPIYTRAFTDTEVNSLWQPFNVHAPLRYLLDGHVSDQSGLTLENLVA